MPPPTRSTFSDITRVFWRFVLFVGVAVAVILTMGFVLKPVFPTGLPFGREGKPLYLLIVALGLGVATLAAAFWEKSGDWAILGLAPEGWRPRGILLAVLGGGGLAAVAAGVLLATRLARFTPLPAGAIVPYASHALLLVALSTLTEALAFRGYLHGLVARRWGAWVAVAVSTLLFTLFHIGGTAPSAMNLVAVLCLGLFLGAVRVRSGGIAAPWLAHCVLGWVQVGVLHSGVSGLELEMPPRYFLALAEPAWLSGRGWGVEGGLVAAAMLLGAAVYLLRPVPYAPPPPARP